MEEFLGGILSTVYFIVFYSVTLIPAFLVGTYIVGREKENRFSTKQIVALILVLIPFLYFVTK